MIEASGNQIPPGPPTQATQLFEYDPSGNLVGNLDFKGQLSTFEFDEVGRESARTFDVPSTPTGDDLTRIEMVYDPILS